MSIPPRRHLPERPSLQQLRKQAKEHLETLRAADPSVNLAVAQHALAREYGFDSWPKLVHHVETGQPANRMLQPAGLKSDQKLLWSPGRGTDVWALIQACTSGDLDGVRALIARDPSLARSHYHYRKPLYFAVRENRIEVVRFLLEHDRNPDRPLGRRRSDRDCPRSRLQRDGTAAAMVETFAQLDELLLTLGASVGRS